MMRRLKAERCEILTDVDRLGARALYGPPLDECDFISWDRT